MRIITACAACTLAFMAVPAAAQAPRSADIEVVSFAGPKSVPVGRTGTFVATIRNNGPSATMSEDFIAALSDLTLFEPVSLKVPGGTCQLSLAPDCALGPLAAGESAQLTAVLKATGDTGKKDSFRLQASRNGAQISEPSPPDVTNNTKRVEDVLITPSPFRLKGTAAKTQTITRLRATYTCTEACTYVAQAVVKVGTKKAVSARATGRLAANVRKTVTFTFRKSTLRALRGMKGDAFLDLTAKNVLGESLFAGPRVRLKR